MGDRRRELNMAHALSADFGLNDLDPALVADDSSVLHALVLTAVALPILDRAENFRAKQPVFFGFKRPVIDGLGFLHLAVGPRPNLFGGCDSDPHRVERHCIAWLLK